MAVFSAAKLALLLMAISFANAEELPLLSEKSATGCSAVRIISRRIWGGGAAGGGRLTVPVSYVFIQHTDGATCRNVIQCSNVVKEIYNTHTQNNNWSDIGYNFLIGGDGRAYEGRGWDRVGAHTYGWNSRAIGIAFIGTFANLPPSAKMQLAAKNLIQCGISKNKIRFNYGLYGHRDGTCTTGPGDAFYRALASWPNWHEKGTIRRYCPSKMTEEIQ